MESVKSPTMQRRSRVSTSLPWSKARGIFVLGEDQHVPDVDQVGFVGEGEVGIGVTGPELPRRQAGALHGELAGPGVEGRRPAAAAMSALPVASTTALAKTTPQPWGVATITPRTHGRDRPARRSRWRRSTVRPRPPGACCATTPFSLRSARMGSPVSPSTVAVKPTRLPAQ